MVVPAGFLGVIAGFNWRAGVAMSLLVLGMAAASVVYVKNRTDRHNAAVERGEIRSIPDPHFHPVERSALPAELVERTAALGHPLADLGKVLRYDRGWVVRQRNPRDVAVVLGDDGGWARFDPRRVTDLWAVAEYDAGRGRDG